MGKPKKRQKQKPVRNADILKRTHEIAKDPKASLVEKHMAGIISDLTLDNMNMGKRMDAIEEKLVAAGVPREKFNSPRGLAARAAAKKKAPRKDASQTALSIVEQVTGGKLKR